MVLIQNKLLRFNINRLFGLVLLKSHEGSGPLMPVLSYQTLILPYSLLV